MGRLLLSPVRILDTVYPRVCGGTADLAGYQLTSAFDDGLSPRVRGNHVEIVHPATPELPGLSPRVRGNHWLPSAPTQLQSTRSIPRVCGGTSLSCLRRVQAL